MTMNGNWLISGHLVTGRHGHNVIFDGEYVLVIGGYGRSNVEKCLLEDDVAKCTEQEP